MHVPSLCWDFFGTIGHAGLIMALVVSLFVYGAMQRKGRKPPRRCKQSRLVAAVLDMFRYGRGRRSLGDRSNRAVDEPRSLSPATPIWSVLSPRWPRPTSWFLRWRRLACSFLFHCLTSGDMDLIKCLLLMVSSFMPYAHIE